MLAEALPAQRARGRRPRYRRRAHVGPWPVVDRGDDVHAALVLREAHDLPVLVADGGPEHRLGRAAKDAV
eukprot:12306184-Alexandrium_andersonii.AAC.1